METRTAKETVLFEFTVVDEDNTPINVSGGQAVFVLTGVFNGLKVIKPCTITTSLLSVELTPTDTETDGLYEYEFWLFFNGKEDCVERDFLLLQHTNKAELDEVPN